MIVESSEEYRVCHPDWPVDLLRVTILCDEEENRYLRVKFQNVGEKVILALKFRFQLECAEGPIELVHSYPQRLIPGESGGLSYKIVVGPHPVRLSSAQLVQVVYAQGEREESFSQQGISYRTGDPIEPEYRMAFQYLAGRSKTMILEHAFHRFYPVAKENGDWVCSCGRYCLHDQGTCPRCKSERKTVFHIVNPKYLERTKQWLDQIDQQKLLKEEQNIRKYEQRKIESERLYRRRVIAVSCILITILAILCSGFLYYTKSYYPTELYKKGELALEKQQYGEAYICFSKAGTYRDAQEQAERAVILRDRKSVAFTGTDFAAVNEDGSVTVFSNNPIFQAASSWTGIVSLSAGKEHLVGLRSDGTVLAVGTNVYGECNVQDFSGIVSIDTGPYHTVGLKSDGTVVAVGFSNNLNQVCAVDDWQGIVSIAASATQTMGIRADGSLVTTAKKTSLNDGELYFDIDCTGMTYEVGLTRKQKAILSSGEEFSSDCILIACAQDVGYAVDFVYRVATSNYANPFLEMQNVREIIVSETGDVFCVTTEGTVRCGGKVAFQQQIEALTGVGAKN